MSVVLHQWEIFPVLPEGGARLSVQGHRLRGGELQRRAGDQGLGSEQGRQGAGAGWLIGVTFS